MKCKSYPEMLPSSGSVSYCLLLLWAQDSPYTHRGRGRGGGGGLYILPSTSFYNPYLLVFLLSIPFLKYVNNLFYPHSGVLFEQHLTPGSEISFLKICLTPSGAPNSIRGWGGKNTIPFFAYLVHKIQR